MEITQNAIYEAFGLGAKAQEPAAPAEDPKPLADTAPGAKAQEPAEPAPAEAAPASEPTGEPAPQAEGPEQPEETGDEAAEPAAMSPERRRENAARRRRQEQREAVDKAVADALQAERAQRDREIQALFDKADLKNSITGKPITTLEEFRDWSRQFEEEKLRRDLKAGKLTPEGLEQVISGHPVMQQAQRLIDQQEQARKAQEDARAKARIDAELAEIGKVDPTIKTVEDLLNMPNAKAFYELVQKGYSFQDAHYLVNRERLERERVEAAKQQALSSVRSKEHLNPVGSSRGTGAASVPAEEMAMFRQFNPGATDAQIQNYYNQYNQRKGG